MAALSVVGLLAATALPAAAGPFGDQKVLGPLAIEPTTGDLETLMTFTTAGGCPQGTNSITRVFGKGFPEDGENIIGNTEVIELLIPGIPDRIEVPSTIHLAEAMRRQAEPVPFGGRYTVKLDCQSDWPDTLDQFYGVYEGELTIKDKTYTALTTTQDLPDPPSPKTGPDALAVPIVAPPTDMPEALLDPKPQSADPAQDAKASAAAGGRNVGVPLAAGGGVVVLGVAGGLLYHRRKKPTAIRSSKLVGSSK